MMHTHDFLDLQHKVNKLTNQLTELQKSHAELHRLVSKLLADKS